jgi:hypothetical protein
MLSPVSLRQVLQAVEEFDDSRDEQVLSSLI